MDARPLLFLASVGLVCLVAGCGGGDRPAPASGAEAPHTKAWFLSEANAICGKVTRERYLHARRYREVHARALAPMEPVQREETVIRAIGLPLIRREVEELDALDAPKGEERKIGRFVASLRNGLKKAEKDPYSIEFEIPSENPFKNAVAFASEYGLVACSSFS